MSSNNTGSPKSRRLAWIGIFAALSTVAVAALLVNIFQRKQEARDPFFRVVELTDDTADPAVWGRNFPMQYAGYLRTVEQQPTKYAGSEAVPHTPTATDPRRVTARSRLEADPRLAVMWAGYAFAVDYRERRGHAYMLDDQRYTRRVTEFQQPGTCLNCHASTYVLMKRLGGGDLFRGFAVMNHTPYNEITKQAKHPVACIDCHDPRTMQLRVTRPAFLEGVKAYKASLGIAGFDANRDATPQEMRSYVCGQCHVEYYFQGPDKRLTFPWTKGLKVDDELAHQDAVKQADWTHAITGAPMLKAQHPEFEVFNQGVHARAGVACADCHMPYKREGAFKVSDHHVRSPLLNVNRACQGCHHFPEEEMRARVEQIQDRFVHARDVAFNALVELIGDIKDARANGAPEAQLAPARDAQRKASFFIDYVTAENSTGFHAPAEAIRILNDATDAIRRGQLALHGVKLRSTP
jgi:nitrite reductase (cytochrome c-552)